MSKQDFATFADHGYDEWRSGMDIEDVVLRNRVVNILAVFDAASPSELEEGMGWYATAHTFAVGLTELAHITTEQACGIIAALSPQVSWDRNQVIARQVVLTDTCAGQTGINVEKAVRIKYGNAPWKEPLDILGGPKVRSFYRNIAFPDIETTVTIDRHAVAIALGGREAGKEETKRLARQGAYEAFEQAYKEAARRRGVLAHECQAVAWCKWRYENGEFFENIAP